MKLHADLSLRALVLPEQMRWVASPEEGVERIMLDRDGDEVARATSLVRFAEDSSFASHTHELGEEVLVLEGVFSDEDGDFGQGSYLRNPPGSTHKPFSKPGCLLFVKLRQFDLHDQTRKMLQRSQFTWEPGELPGVSRVLLHQFGSEVVCLVRLEPGASWPRLPLPAGEELFVIEGSCSDELGDYPCRSWLRTPAGGEHQVYSQDGCLLYIKTGHLSIEAALPTRAY
jgi:anti-sigma factor ChrR (cupin superfamily)